METNLYNRAAKIEPEHEYFDAFSHAFSELNRLGMLQEGAVADVRVATFTKEERVKNIKGICASSNKDCVVIDKSLCQRFTPKMLNSYIALAILSQNYVSSTARSITHSFNKSIATSANLALLAASMCGNVNDDKKSEYTYIIMAAAITAVILAAMYKIFTATEDGKHIYSKNSEKLLTTNGFTDTMHDVIQAYKQQSLSGGRRIG